VQHRLHHEYDPQYADRIRVGLNSPLNRESPSGSRRRYVNTTWQPRRHRLALFVFVSSSSSSSFLFVSRSCFPLSLALADGMFHTRFTTRASACSRYSKSADEQSAKSCQTGKRVTPLATTVCRRAGGIRQRIDRKRITTNLLVVHSRSAAAESRSSIEQERLVSAIWNRLACKEPSVSRLEIRDSRFASHRAL